MTGDEVMMKRRVFLKQSAISAGFLLVGVQLPATSVPGPRGQVERLVTDAFIRLAPDNAVTILMNHAEFGNGAYTSLSMMVAEELDLDWERINLEAAPTEPEYYSPLFGEYLTAGSVSTASSFMPMRLAGARTRSLLLEAAARHWATDVSRLSTAASHVYGDDGRRIAYGDLIPVIRALNLSPPADVTLKDAADYRILGKPTRRIEAREKLDGSAIYGIDVRLPGMLYGVVQRPPVYGARVISFEAGAARQLPGVVKVKAIDAGVVVLAKDYWTARQAADLVNVNWDNRQLDRLSTADFVNEYRAMSQQPGMVAEDIGDARRVLAESGQSYEAVYEMPYLAHATMEPMNCTAVVEADRCEVWTGTQYQSNDRTVVARLLGLPESSVTINRTLMGGSFGRRASKSADYVTDAVQAAQGEGRPVQIIWSREEDIRGGHYRPLFVHRLRGALDSAGYPLAWHQTVVGQSIMQHTKHDPAYMVRGMDIYSLDGCLQEPFGVFPYGTSYQIPHHRVESHNPPKVGVVPQEWRSVGHSHTGIAYECFLDELAHHGGKDPLDLRLYLTREHPRMHRVLQTVKRLSGWQEPLEEGRGRGVASRIYSVSPIAQVVEVTVAEGGVYTIDRIVCVVDCGFAVNPLGIESQIQGGIMLGLNAAAYGAIDIEQGAVVQSNFHDYRPLRINQMPDVEVHILSSQEAPTGVGEQATTPAAPALANALFAATGRRVRQFPLDRHGFTLKS